MAKTLSDLRNRASQGSSNVEIIQGLAQNFAAPVSSPIPVVLPEISQENIQVGVQDPRVTVLDTSLKNLNSPVETKPALETVSAADYAELQERIAKLEANLKASSPSLFSILARSILDAFGSKEIKAEIIEESNPHAGVLGAVNAITRFFRKPETEISEAKNTKKPFRVENGKGDWSQFVITGNPKK